MLIHQKIKEVITECKKEIELTQIAITSGIASLVYSEYIRKIQRKQTPVQVIIVPEIHAVRELLIRDGKFIDMLSNRLIEAISMNELFREYSNAPEFVLFTGEKIEILKTIFDLYMVMNIGRSIPETIETKFDLRNPENQLVRQGREIDLFRREPVSEKQFQFIVEQTILHLLMLAKSVKKNVTFPEDNMNVHATEREILTIDNDNAICPIHFSNRILRLIDVYKEDFTAKTKGGDRIDAIETEVAIINEKMSDKELIDLLSFVTSTTITSFTGCDICPARNNGEAIRYSITTSPFNRVSLTTFEGIEINTGD